jgi:hypothetical protein
VPCGNKADAITVVTLAEAEATLAV